MTRKWDAEAARAKQDEFLDRWVSGEGIPFENDQAKADYQERAGLIRDAIQVEKKPARVPVMPLTTFAPTQMAGVSGKEAMYNPDAAGKAYVDFMNTYQPDAAGIAPMIMYGPPLETLQYKLYKWPGNNVPDDSPYQFCEKEYMKPEDYRQLISDPTDYFLRNWIPKTHGALEGLSLLPPIQSTMELPLSGNWLAALGAPPVQAALKALMEAGKQTFDWIQILGGYLMKIMAAGYPFYAGGATKAPFDTIGDSLRGTTPFMMDMFRIPEKVIEASERLVEPMIATGVEGAVAQNNPLVFIPLHKGADGFMSNEQFEKFYWPTLKAVMRGLSSEGCVPVCFVEGGYNQRLEYLQDTADMRCCYLFDRTDMKEARRILGGKVCIGGGFPVTSILAGTPEKVATEAKELLEAAKGDGGFVMTIGCALDEGKADTMKAFIDASKEFGSY